MAEPSRPAGAHGGHPIHIHPVRPLYRFAATGLGASMWFFVSRSIPFNTCPTSLTWSLVDVQSQKGTKSQLARPDTFTRINLDQRTALLSSAGSTPGTTRPFAFLFFNAFTRTCLYHNTNSFVYAFSNK